MIGKYGLNTSANAVSGRVQIIIILFILLKLYSSSTHWFESAAAVCGKDDIPKIRSKSKSFKKIFLIIINPPYISNDAIIY